MTNTPDTNFKVIDNHPDTQARVAKMLEKENDDSGDALTAAYLYGFERGKASILENPDKSVIGWVKYDGNDDTLPDKKKKVLLVNRHLSEVSAFFDDEDNLLAKLKIGDLWGYLPMLPAGGRRGGYEATYGI